MIHIHRFIDKIQQCENKRMKNVQLTMKEAKDLHADITKLLLVLHEIQKQPVESTAVVEEVEITGGKW